MTELTIGSKVIHSSLSRKGNIYVVVSIRPFDPKAGELYQYIHVVPEGLIGTNFEYDLDSQLIFYRKNLTLVEQQYEGDNWI